MVKLTPYHVRLLWFDVIKLINNSMIFFAFYFLKFIRNNKLFLCYDEFFMKNSTLLIKISL
ncbi:hypothetical protein A1OE_1409 [Candidatus Endolissoclinum faulkneri L2]|uniref:Uncharacterized protein n=1 Tax=Candidatus Endolissoclinum faulkneri L2 TaxID=1193729 RepID=K7Z618_9PROT|nr:hypothetical protein A1OE_1409 [Candidatus Endolissoclinum faulkneri L2]